MDSTSTSTLTSLASSNRRNSTFPFFDYEPAFSLSHQLNSRNSGSTNHAYASWMTGRHVRRPDPVLSHGPPILMTVCCGTLHPYARVWHRSFCSVSRPVLGVPVWEDMLLILEAFTRIRTWKIFHSWASNTIFKAEGLASDLGMSIAMTLVKSVPMVCRGHSGCD